MAKVVYNCRIMATLLYEIVQLSSPYLPDTYTDNAGSVAASSPTREVGSAVSPRIYGSSLRGTDGVAAETASTNVDLFTNCFRSAFGGTVWEDWASQSQIHADGASNSEVGCYAIHNLTMLMSP